MAKQKITTAINHRINRLRGDSVDLEESGMPQLGHFLSSTVIEPLQCWQLNSLILR